MGDYDGLTKDELQDELDARELPTSGNKDELVARLEADDDANGMQVAPKAEVLEVTIEDALPTSEPDENGLVGVSPEFRRKAGSIHYSANTKA